MYVSMMVTPHLQKIYLREHREAKKVAPSEMAKKLGIERESVHRLERKRMVKWAAAYARHLNLTVGELYSPPGIQSLDAIIALAPEMRDLAVDIVTRLVADSTLSRRK